MSSSPTFKLVLNQIIIPFKVKFRHASAERAETSSIWVEAISTSGIIGYGESCPRSYVTGETMASVQHFYSQYQDAICNEISNLSTLRAWVTTHQNALNANPAGWCAIELAILDLLAKQENKTIEQLLNLPALHDSFQYSAVLGDANTEAFQQNTQQYIQQGFRDFKLKLSGELERDKQKIAFMRQWENIRVRVDANNLWQSTDEAIHFLQALDYPFFAIEEPLQANAYNGLSIIANSLNCKVILDESFLRIEQFNTLQASSQYWLINLRISKMGGLLRSLAIIESARELDIGLIVGAQVGETSLLTRCGLTAAQAASKILVAQEGAFGTHLLENDICESSLMFAKAGLLDVANHPSLSQPGLGFTIQKKPDFISTLF
jgi:L-alanine-DL-glutamate epimerase-like enolase superfamily enzyme